MARATGGLVAVALGSILAGVSSMPPAALVANADTLPLSLVVASDPSGRFERSRSGRVTMYGVDTLPPERQAEGTGEKQSSEFAEGTAFVDVDARGNVIVAAAQHAGMHLFEVVGDGTLVRRSVTRAGTLFGDEPASVVSTALVEGPAGDLYAFVGWAHNVASFDGGATWGGFDVYRVSPRTVTRVYRTPDTEFGEVRAFAVRGNRLVATMNYFSSAILDTKCARDLLVYDISSPPQPRLVGRGPIARGGACDVSPPVHVSLAGTFALVADGNDVHLVSVGGLGGNPTPFGTRETPGEAMATAVAADRFYIADGSNGLIAGDIRGLVANRAAALVERDSDAPQDLVGDAIDVAIDERTNLAYVASEGRGVEIHDVSQRTPAWEMTLTMSGFAHAVALFPFTVEPPCTDDARLVTGNRATVRAGTRFDVAPVLINAGTCTWTADRGYHLAHVDGDRLGARARIDLAPGASHPPGQGQNFVLTMTAPASPGRVISRWQMRRDSGAFGPVIDVIVDVEAPSPTPTLAPTSTRVPSATPPPTPHPSPTRPPTPVPLPPPAPTRPPTAVPPEPPARDHVALLVHGYLGFGGGSGNACTPRPSAYRPGVDQDFDLLARTLSADRYHVFIAKWRTGPSSTSDLPEARLCLGHQITWLREQYPGKRITLIAHSMGGLVSRAYVEHTRDASVDHLVTFGSPHHGVMWKAVLAARAMFTTRLFVGCDADPGTCALSTESMSAFNQANPLFPRTRYHLIGGSGDWWASQAWPGNMRVADDGIITLPSSLGDTLGSEPFVRRWETDDVHSPKMVDLFKKPYESSEQSAACLREALGLGGSNGACIEHGGLLASAVLDASATDQMSVSDALSPLREVELGPHLHRATDVIVDGEPATVNISTTSNAVETWLETPSGQWLPNERPGDVLPGATFGSVPLPSGGEMVVYTLPKPEAGRWRAHVRETEGRQARAVILASFDSPVLVSLSAPGSITARFPIVVDVRLARDGQAIQADEIEGRIDLGGGESLDLDFRREAPGLYRATPSAPARAGYYPITVVARGRGEGGGLAFEHTDAAMLVVQPEAPVYLPLVARSADLAGSPARHPTDIAFAVDTSAAMRSAFGAAPSKLAAVVDALTRSLDLLGSGGVVDRAAVLGYSLKPEVLQALTADIDSIRSAVTRLPGEPATASRLEPALYEAVGVLGDGRPGARRVLVLMSSTASSAAVGDATVAVAETVKASGIRIIVVGIGEDGNGDGLRRLASDPRDMLLARNQDELSAAVRRAIYLAQHAD